MEVVFTFSSTHGAVNGERVLLAGGLAVKVMPLPSCLGAGCGLCLRLARADLSEALNILANSGLKAQGLYLKERQDGRIRYQAIVDPANSSEAAPLNEK